jgi:putative acetyltransferase
MRMRGRSFEQAMNSPTTDMRVVLRQYLPADAPTLMVLFHETVRAVCARDYSPDQLAAWSPESGLNVERWAARFAITKPLVAVTMDGPIGFIELEADGHIDCLYVHRDWQRKGIGTMLLERVIAESKRGPNDRLHAEVSLTALGFFEAHGFTIVSAQEVERNGQRLKNFRMERV